MGWILAHNRTPNKVSVTVESELTWTVIQHQRHNTCLGA